MRNSSPIADVAKGETLLALGAIRKSFGGVEVLKGIDFDVRSGEVHALCGENGAGKSTLMNIMAGVLQPDDGSITFGGKTFRAFASAHAARQAGIGMVFQERTLFAPLSVAENIFAGRQPVTSWGMIDKGRMYGDAARLLSEVAPDVSSDAAVAELSPAHQQMVEIAKVLSLDARVLVFDEPTAALTASETDRLFLIIRGLRRRGAGIVYISHRFDEVFKLADRVTVLKDGNGQGTVPVAETDADDLIRRMVGRDLETAGPDFYASANPVLFEVLDLSDKPRSGVIPLLKDVSFNVRKGEIVGLCGLAGAGRTETAMALFGARPDTRGEVTLGGRRLSIHSPAEAISAGLGYVSEDRKESGLFLEMSIRRNVSAARLDNFGNWFYRERQESALASEFQRKLRIVCRDVEQDTGHLSGGNQQKVLLARWLLVNPLVLIVDEPTRGVDVGAKAEVHQLLREFAAQGHAVIVISSDLPEALALSDRIYVMRAGRISGELKRDEATEEAVMRLAAGGGAK